MRLKLLRPLLCGAFLFAAVSPTIGQTIRCYSTEYDSIRHAQNPDLQSNEEFEEWLAKMINEKQHKAQSQMIINGVYQIPVVVHVIHNGEAVGTGTNISQAAIQSQIDVLNEDFRKIFGTNGYNTHPDGSDTQIEFCLARRRPDGTAFPGGEDGINRINRSTAGFTAPPYNTGYIDGTIKPYCTVTQGWDPGDYMNFWVMNLGGGLLGYAQFPTTILGGMSCGSQDQNTDGVVMLYSSIGKSSVTGYPGPYNEGRTATHEIGHWLGLRHIWGDGGCGVDDYCLDTPESDAANYGCPTTHVSCGSTDMVQNYMDYTDDDCMNIFTNDQRMRMRTVLENSPIRASLINSDACIPPAVSDASVINIINPVGDNCAGTITPTVTLRNRGSSNLTSATIEYTIDNGTPVSFAWTGTITPGNQANVNLPSFTAPLGTHVFKARSLLPNGVTDPDVTYDESEITFAVSNGYQPDYAQDFDGGTFPPDVRWNVDNPNGDCFEWVGGTAVSSTGVTNNACAVMTNFGNATNQNEYLYTPIFILPCNASAAELAFDVAYRRRVTGSTDRLRVEISTDCGATWANAGYDKSGTTLQTVTTTSNSYWIPNAAGNWRNEVIDLSSYVSGSSESIQFRFRATNAGNGGNIYVDNVNLTAVTPGEIQLEVAGSEVLDGGSYNYGAQAIGAPTTATFTIENTGTSNLTLTGPIAITGNAEFTINTTFGTTTVAPGATTTFSIDFTPTGAGPYSATVSFGTNDCDEGTYNFTLNGSGLVTPPAAGFSGTPLAICQGNTVTYTDASTGATSWSWDFEGGTPATATGAGPHTITYNTAGAYDVELTVTNTYGSDVATQNNYVSVLSGTGNPLPVAEGFVATTFPPTNWSVTNGGNAATWQRTTAAGNAPTAGSSARIDNFNTDTNGDEDDLNVLPVDLSGFSSATLTFDVAYARYNATYFDRLDVLVSNDCGQTYTQVFSKSGTTLATDADQTAAYTPGTWRNETVDLTPYVGSNKVDVKFRCISGYGQFLYIDNVNITGVATLASADFTVSPNPVCVGQSVTYTDASIGATSWSWDFGAGASPATATGQGPHTVTYATAGTKNPTLIINSGADNATTSLTVNALDNAGFNYSAASYCSGGTDPAPTITGLTGGTFSASPAGLQINAATGVIDVSASTAGTYTVTYTTNGACPNTQNATVTINATPSAPVVTVSNNCGNSTLTATGSNLLWSTGETTASISVTAAGTYTVTQTVGGCTSAAGSGVAAPIVIPSAPVVTVSNNCGNSTLTASGSNLLWSTGETTASISVTAAGTYTVTQTVGGCTSTAGSGTAAPIAIPSAPIVTVSNNCGNSTLTATSSNLLWSTGETTASITVTAAGTYTVTQTVGGCTSTTGSGIAAPIAIPSAPVVTVSNNCGSSTLTATGSNLLWSTGETTASITVTVAGTYTVTQTVGGCTSAAGSGVAAPIAIPSAPVVTVSNNCGNSTLTATGSNLLWSTGETTASISVTAAGTYTVTQTVGGCTSAAGSGVASPLVIPAISATGSNPVSCGATNGSITVSGSGTGNVTWSGSASGTATAVTLPYTITNLSAGSYTIQFNNGCPSNSVNQLLSDPSAPSTPVVTVSNNCGSSTLTTTGSNLLWSTGETTASITVTAAGTYTVTQTVGGCTSATGSGTAAPIAIPSAPVVTVSNNCGNSTLTATGSNLLWSTGETTASITVTAAGTYTVTQTVGGCTSATGSGTAAPIAIPSAPVVTVSNNCGSSTLTATGSNLLWSTGETTASITVTAAGTYTVTQTVGGCTSATGSGTAAPIAIPSAPVVTVSNNCGSSTLTATGSNLLWSTGETTASITVTAAGTYTVTQTVGGCTSATGSGTAAPIAIPSAPVVTVSNNCGSSTLTATGSNLLWSTGETTASITVTTAGTYTVTQTVGGCTSAAGSGTAAPIAIPSAPVVTVSDNCGTSTLTATGSNLLWSTGETTASITVTVGGTYTVTQTIGGCTSAAGSGIANPAGGPASPVVTVSDNCGSSTLTATGSNLLWSTGETTASITVTAAGTYTVTQTVGGCTSAAGSGVAAPLAIPSAPVVTVSNNCGSSTLTATGSNLLWSTGETTASITVTAAGTYTVTQTVGGCASAAGSGTAAPIAIPSAPVVTVSDNCGTSTLTATGSNLLWSNGATTPSITVTSGTYSVTQTIGVCVSDAAVVTANPLPVPSAPVVTVSDNCGSSLLTATGSNLMWSTGETTATISVTSPGTYTVTQTAAGCTSVPTTTVANPLPLPIVTFGSLGGVCDYNPAFTLNQGSPAGGTYSGNGVNANQFDPAVAGEGAWTLTYTFTDGNGCTNSAQSTIFVDACVGVEEDKLSISIHPNPTGGAVKIETGELIQWCEVYDNTGKLVQRIEVTDAKQTEIDLSNYADGMYQLVVATETGHFNERIVLKK